MKQHEVVIVGDGVIGLTLALALVQRGINTGLFLQTAPTQLSTRYDARVSAITQASERIFKHLGVWEEIVGRRVSPFRDMRVWDAGGAGELHFDSASTGLAHLGHIIENSILINVLREKLAAYSELHCYENRSLQELIQPADGVIIKTDQETLFTQLLVGADGANSWVRSQAGIELEESAYQQTALVTTVQTELPHQETASQRFLSTGPLAFLPLNDSHYCSIVWSCAPEYAKQLLALNEAQFCQHLGVAFDFKLGKILQAETRQHFPLVMRHAKQYVKPHIALVGDAAHTLHPLAGQGMNLGLMDVAVLVDVIAKTQQLNRPLGMLSLLRAYERERRSANLLMIKLMSGLNQLFSNEQSLLTMLRNTGLTATDKCSWLKILFMQQAMGNQIQLPSLAQEV